MRQRSASWLWILGVGLCTGCSVQATTGWSAHAPEAAGRALGKRDAWPRVLAGGAQIDSGREGGPTGGGQATFLLESNERPIALRNLLAVAGYQWRRPFGPGSGVSFEVGTELGIGEPTRRDFDDVGVFIGGRALLLYRLFGDYEYDRSTYHTFAMMVDAIAVGRSGVWSAPEGESNTTIYEGGVHLGLRLSFGSDVANATRRAPSGGTSSKAVDGPGGAQ